MRTDTEIRNDVLSELEWDSRVPSSEISATVRDGVVTLVGVAPSYAAKLAAQEAAHRARGVLDVASEIEVIPGGTSARSDADLLHAVRRALEWDALLDASRIHATVTGGWVTISGTTDLVRQREDAECSVQHLAGVRGVINRIEVIGAPAAVEDVRAAVLGALQRRAEHEAKHIRVSVADHVVTLTGKVDSWLEKRAVLGMVGHIPGVRGVTDALEIDPYRS